MEINITHLAHGAHSSREDGVCLMEAIAWLAGEAHSDSPACTSTTLAAFARVWNDALDDADRDRLCLPLLHDLLGTGPLTADQEQALGLAVCDWLVRHWVSAWLDLVPALADHAQRLRSARPVSSGAALIEVVPVLQAGATASAAAWDAAWDAARDAAGDAARDAARDAAGAAAWAAAGNAAWAAAWAAARDAAGAALRPTVESLQADAQKLLRTLCARAKAMRAEIVS